MYMIKAVCVCVCVCVRARARARVGICPVPISLSLPPAPPPLSPPPLSLARVRSLYRSRAGSNKALARSKLIFTWEIIIDSTALEQDPSRLWHECVRRRAARNRNSEKSATWYIGYIRAL
jgi:hypothetical protein